MFCMCNNMCVACYSWLTNTAPKTLSEMQFCFFVYLNNLHSLNNKQLYTVLLLDYYYCTHSWWASVVLFLVIKLIYPTILLF